MDCGVECLVRVEINDGSFHLHRDAGKWSLAEAFGAWGKTDEAVGFGEGSKFVLRWILAVFKSEMRVDEGGELHFFALETGEESAVGASDAGEGAPLVKLIGAGGVEGERERGDEMRGGFHDIWRDALETGFTQESFRALTERFYGVGDARR